MMMKLNYEKIKKLYPRRDDRCVTQDSVDGELLVLKIEKSRIRGYDHYAFKGISLNREGKDVWKLCDGMNTIEEIISKLHGEYIVDKVTLVDDLIKMIENLLNEGYLSLEKRKKVVRRINLESYPHYKDDIIWRTFDENFVILNMKNSALFTFPRKIEKLWKLCNGRNNIKHILMKTKNLDTSLINGSKLVKTEKVEEHVLSVLKLLKELELIKISSSKI
jgi:hypothetical protein